jgi:hypothetical protein
MRPVELASQLMVRPAPDWGDTDDGFQRDTARIVVSESEYTVVRSGEQQSITGYAVRAWDTESGLEGRTEVATFEDARAAWEFANLLTHYFSERSVEGGLEALQDDSQGIALPPRGLTDRDPETLLRDALGEAEHHLDAALGE